MGPNPYRSPKQKLAIRLCFSVFVLCFAGTVMRKHDVHGVMTDPNIPAGIVAIAIALIAAVIVILVYKNEIKDKP